MAFRWKSCGNMEVLFGLLVFSFTLNEISSDCNYFQNLETGKTYYAYNTDYPSTTKGQIKCVWKMTYYHDITINCSIDIPASTNCVQQSLSVQFKEEKYPKRYCGKSTADLSGKENATITFYLSDQKEGKFLCGIRGKPPIEKINCNICGRHNNNNVTRIVGGNETGVNEYPMMAGLVDFKQKMIYCGSTIISEQYVVTAAHCIENKDITQIGVVVGEHDVTTGKDTNATQLFRLSNCIIHPKYSGNLANDVAVCKIVGNITFNNEVGPVCLPFQHKYDTFDDDIVTALGWGLLEYAGSKSTTLQKVNLKVINLEKCKNAYSNVSNTNMCTYTPGKDTCQMDSGGPVLWKDPTTRKLVLAGITSTGIGCGSDEPSVDMRIGAYLDWIESVTPDVQYCKME